MDPIPIAAGRRGRVRKSTSPLRGVESPPDAPKPTADGIDTQRRMLAAFCRLLEEQVTGRPGTKLNPPPSESKLDPRVRGLAPRVRQTLARMLAGDSEKEIARNLGLSPHTVHVYVKSLYRHFEVNSRGELLAKFVATLD